MRVESKITKSRKTQRGDSTRNYGEYMRSFSETTNSFVFTGILPQASKLEIFISRTHHYHNISELEQKKVPYHSYDRELPIGIWFPGPTIITGVCSPYRTCQEPFHTRCAKSQIKARRCEQQLFSKYDILKCLCQYTNRTSYPGSVTLTIV